MRSSRLGQGGGAGANLAAADQHVGQNQSEGVDVGPVIDRFGPRLLGRHVVQRPDDRADNGAAAGAR